MTQTGKVCNWKFDDKSRSKSPKTSSQTEIMGRAIQMVRCIHAVSNYEDWTTERKARSKVKLITDRKQESKERINQTEPSDIRRNMLSLGRLKQKTMVIRL